MGEVRPGRGTVVLIGGWGIRIKARTARWVAGCTAAVSVALIGAELALAYVDRHLLPASLTEWTVSGVSGQVVNMAVPVTGFVLASRRPENRMGWLFLVAGLGLGLSGFSNSYALHALVAAPGSLPAGRAFAWLNGWIWVIPVAMLAYLFLLFPTGYVRSRRWRGAAWLTGGAFALVAVCGLIAATRSWVHPFLLSSPVGLTAALLLVTTVLVSAAMMVCVAALVVRFAKSSGEERLQLKWCAAAAFVLVVVFVAAFWVTSAAVNVLQNVAFVGLWTAIAVAVLKYRLYDIDRVISRTLAYAIVTGLLVGVYAGLVLLATQVFRFHSTVAVAASTLAAAVLFNPLRRRVQQVVDRRFNRARYDAEQTVAAFAARLKDTVDLDSVRDDLAGVVHQALEPAHVSVWINERG
jgi:MFS family permease